MPRSDVQLFRDPEPVKSRKRETVARFTSDAARAGDVSDRYLSSRPQTDSTASRYHRKRYARSFQGRARAYAASDRGSSR